MKVKVIDAELYNTPELEGHEFPAVPCESLEGEVFGYEIYGADLAIHSASWGQEDPDWLFFFNLKQVEVV